MSTTTTETERKYTLKKPPGHKVPVPRWHLQLPKDVTHTYTLYIGVQSHEAPAETLRHLEESIQDLLNESSGKPAAIDTLRVTAGYDIQGTKVWVAYWTDFEAFRLKLGSIDLQKIWHDIPSENRNSVGLWCEHFTTPLERLETNYARLEHKPGLAQIPGSEQPSHDLTGYWGAGRDRIPASADDMFGFPEKEVVAAPEKKPRGFKEYIFGTNYDNMCHIRMPNSNSIPLV